MMTDKKEKAFPQIRSPTKEMLKSLQSSIIKT